MTTATWVRDRAPRLQFSATPQLAGERHSVGGARARAAVVVRTGAGRAPTVSTVPVAVVRSRLGHGYGRSSGGSGSPRRPHERDLLLNPRCHGRRDEAVSSGTREC